MNAKTLLVPVASLSEPVKIDFLELSVEPASEPPQDAFSSLGHLGLGQAAQAALRAWERLQPAFPAKVQVKNPGLPVTNSAGAGLALALCPFLLAPACPYRTVLALGSLEFPDGSQDVWANAADRLAEKLNAIRRRGYRVKPELLILPWDGTLDDPEDGLLNQLAALNVAVRQVNSLAEARGACDGRIRQP